MERACHSNPREVDASASQTRNRPTCARALPARPRPGLSARGPARLWVPVEQVRPRRVDGSVDRRNRFHNRCGHKWVPISTDVRNWEKTQSHITRNPARALLMSRRRVTQARAARAVMTSRRRVTQARGARALVTSRRRVPRARGVLSNSHQGSHCFVTNSTASCFQTGQKLDF